MKATKKTVLIMALMCLFVVSVQAEVITIFDSNATINSSYDTVVVKGDGTVVDMTGGDVNTVIVMNTAIFNMSGGNIGIEDSEGVIGYDLSVLNLSGGTLNIIKAYGESEVNVFGSVVVGETSDFYGSSVVNISSDPNLNGWLSFYENSTLNLHGGLLRSAQFLGHSTINITGGTVSSNLNSYEYSLTSISGGTIDRLQVSDKAIVTISGGTINTIFTWIGLMYSVYPISINIVGYDLSLVPYDGSNGHGQVSGYWNDDKSFTINLSNRMTYPAITLYDGIIPVSCTNKPESDLSGDCKVNFKDLSKMALEWLNDGTN